MDPTTGGATRIHTMSPMRSNDVATGIFMVVEKKEIHRAAYRSFKSVFLQVRYV